MKGETMSDEEYETRSEIAKSVQNKARTAPSRSNKKRESRHTNNDEPDFQVDKKFLAKAENVINLNKNKRQKIDENTYKHSSFNNKGYHNKRFFNQSKSTVGTLIEKIEKDKLNKEDKTQIAQNLPILDKIYTITTEKTIRERLKQLIQPEVVNYLKDIIYNGNRLATYTKAYSKYDLIGPAYIENIINTYYALKSDEDNEELEELSKFDKWLHDGAIKAIGYTGYHFNNHLASILLTESKNDSDKFNLSIVALRNIYSDLEKIKEEVEMGDYSKKKYQAAVDALQNCVQNDIFKVELSEDILTGELLLSNNASKSHEENTSSKIIDLSVRDAQSSDKDLTPIVENNNRQADSSDSQANDLINQLESGKLKSLTKETVLGLAKDLSLFNIVYEGLSDKGIRKKFLNYMQPHLISYLDNIIDDGKQLIKYTKLYSKNIPIDSNYIKIIIDKYNALKASANQSMLDKWLLDGGLKSIGYVKYYFDGQLANILKSESVDSIDKLYISVKVLNKIYSDVSCIKDTNLETNIQRKCESALAECNKFLEDDIFRNKLSYLNKPSKVIKNKYTNENIIELNSKANSLADDLVKMVEKINILENDKRKPMELFSLYKKYEETKNEFDVICDKQLQFSEMANKTEASPRVIKY